MWWIWAGLCYIFMYATYRHAVKLGDGEFVTQTSDEWLSLIVLRGYVFGLMGLGFACLATLTYY